MILWISYSNCNEYHFICFAVIWIYYLLYEWLIMINFAFFMYNNCVVYDICLAWQSSACSMLLACHYTLEYKFFLYLLPEFLSYFPQMSMSHHSWRCVCLVTTWGVTVMVVPRPQEWLFLSLLLLSPPGLHMHTLRSLRWVMIVVYS